MKKWASLQPEKELIIIRNGKYGDEVTQLFNQTYFIIYYFMNLVAMTNFLILNEEIQVIPQKQNKFSQKNCKVV